MGCNVYARISLTETSSTETEAMKITGTSNWVSQEQEMMRMMYEVIVNSMAAMRQCDDNCDEQRIDA